MTPLLKLHRWRFAFALSLVVVIFTVLILSFPIGSALNAITAATMLALLGTGLCRWARMRQTTPKDAAEV